MSVMAMGQAPTDTVEGRDEPGTPNPGTRRGDRWGDRAAGDLPDGAIRAGSLCGLLAPGTIPALGRLRWAVAPPRRLAPPARPGCRASYGGFDGGAIVLRYGVT
jgi:hypothetical protein